MRISFDLLGTVSSAMPFVWMFVVVVTVVVIVLLLVWPLIWARITGRRAQPRAENRPIEFGAEDVASERKMRIASQDMLVQFEEIARDLTARLHTRIQLLNKLLDRADATIHELKKLDVRLTAMKEAAEKSRVAPPGAEPPAPDTPPVKKESAPPEEENFDASIDHSLEELTRKRLAETGAKDEGGELSAIDSGLREIEDTLKTIRGKHVRENGAAATDSDGPVDRNESDERRSRRFPATSPDEMIERIHGGERRREEREPGEIKKTVEEWREAADTYQAGDHPGERFEKFMKIAQESAQRKKPHVMTQAVNAVKKNNLESDNDTARKKFDQVLNLYGAGKSITRIAEETGLPKGEVCLILSLRESRDNSGT